MFHIGCDIEEISRFDDKKGDDAFLNLVYSARELKYCFESECYAPRLAGRYSGKEAVVKALGSAGIAGIEYRDIEIVNNEDGVPNVTIIKEIPFGLEIRLSISHCKTHAMANVLVIVTQSPTQA